MSRPRRIPPVISMCVSLFPWLSLVILNTLAAKSSGYSFIRVYSPSPSSSPSIPSSLRAEPKYTGKSSRFKIRPAISSVPIGPPVSRYLSIRASSHMAMVSRSSSLRSRGSGSSMQLSLSLSRMSLSRESLSMPGLSILFMNIKVGISYSFRSDHRVSVCPLTPSVPLITNMQ